MSDLLRVFGSQLDPSVVQGLLRQERQLEASKRNRERAEATARRRRVRSRHRQNFRRN